MSRGLSDRLLASRLLNEVTEANADITSLERAAKMAARNPGDVISMLNECLADSRLREISARSYWHANGFAKFTLGYGAAAALMRLRLHVWLADEAGNQPGGDQNVHGHRWNFGSVVIAGSGLHIEEYVKGTGDGAPYDAYEYRGDDQLEPAGTVLLERSVSYHVGLHDTYACDVGRLHTVRSAPGQVTATLVIQGPTLLAAAPVFRRPDQGPQAAPRQMTLSQARAVLSATVEAASGSGGA